MEANAGSYIVLKRADMKIFKLMVVTLICAMQGTIQDASAVTAQEGEASYYADSLNAVKQAIDEFGDRQQDRQRRTLRQKCIIGRASFTTLWNESQGYQPGIRSISGSRD